MNEEFNVPVSSKTYARRRLMKRIGLIGGSISAVLIIILIFFAIIFPKNMGEFSIVVDTPNSSEAHFTMRNSFDEETSEEVRYIRATPITRATPVSASNIEDYLNAFNESKEVVIGQNGNWFIQNQDTGIKASTNSSTEPVIGENGNWWIGEKDTGIKKADGSWNDGLNPLERINGGHNYVDAAKNEEYAIVYTVALENTSSSEDQVMRYAVHLESHKLPSNSANDPFDYLRILVQTSEVDSTGAIDINKKNQYFGNSISPDEFKRPITSACVEDQYREPISSWKAIPDETGNSYAEATYVSETGQEYCTNFNNVDSTYNQLINEQITIPAGKTLRFTFVSYYELNDYEARGDRPLDSYTLLSLHFGL